MNFTKIYSSDLQRAYKTADTIRHAQNFPSDGEQTDPLVVTPLVLLREQDFGSLEGKPFYARPRGNNKTGKEDYRKKHLGDPDFKDTETKESMMVRMNVFLDTHLMWQIELEDKLRQQTVAIVSHGIILSTLWRCILKRFHESSVRLGPGVPLGPLERLGGWSNTGYLELDVSDRGVTEQIDAKSTHVHEPSDSYVVEDGVTLLIGRLMTVIAVNSMDHIKGFKRTGGGIGRSQLDENQKKIDSFFKKPKLG